ncbi:MAG: hypothetical protein N3A61_08935 [Ignavibacteria bacterium]|nr:hypothetical protein [Ignavibacteria bacterium]
MRHSFLLIFFAATLGFSQTSILELKSNLEQNKVITPSIKLSVDSKSEKSGTLAFFFSFLLPGMGELYLDRYDLGKYFTSAEAALWLSFAGMTYYADWKKDNYIRFAELNAEINSSGKGDDFYSRIGNYMNVNDFNNEQYLNRDFEKVLDVKNYFWSWNSNDLRKQYRELWLSSERAYNNRIFAVALIIINHLVSAIHSAILTAKYNESIQSSSININSNIINDKHLGLTYQLNLTTSF